jgi:hypothetical protein
MSKEVDFVLEGLSVEELKDTVVKNVREINRLKEDSKSYSKSIRETVKGLEERNKDALELIELKNNG